MIAHIVLFTPHEGISAEARRSLAKSMLAAIGQLPYIWRASIGRAVDIDPGYSRSMGQFTYSHAAILEFTDATALVNYLRHPAHAELGRLFWEISAQATVIELETKSPSEWNADELV